MAKGINDLVFYTSLGRANTTVGLPVDATGIGSFVLDYSKATILKINEAGTLGSTMWLDSDAAGSLPVNHPEEPTATTRKTGDQTIVGGPYDGMKVAVGRNTVIRYDSSNDPDPDEQDNQVGRVYEIKVDSNNDGTFDKVIGFAFEKAWAFSNTLHVNGATYYGSAANQPGYSLNWDMATPANAITDDAPPDIHEVALFSTLGTATLANFASNMGGFTLDYTQSKRLTIKDTGAANIGKNDWLEPDAGTTIAQPDASHPTQSQTSSVGQTIVGGPYDGMRVAVGRNHVIREDNGGNGSQNWIVGRVWEIMVDTNNDGICETRIGYAIGNSGSWTNFPIMQGQKYLDGGLSVYQGLEYTLIGDVVCFCRGTMILTSKGPRPVETLRIGDMVQTMDNGFQPIRWIGGRALTAQTLTMQPNLRPIRIAAGALGRGLPQTDLIVSPQHRILLTSQVAQRMFGQYEILVAAKQLLAVPGIEIVENDQDVEYWHFLMDRHEVVFSNGAATESLLPGKEALKSVSSAALKDIYAIFPELMTMSDEDKPATARFVPTGRHARKLADRITANKRFLCDRPPTIQPVLQIQKAS